MKKANKAKRIVCAVLIMCMAFASGTTAFSESNPITAYRLDPDEKISSRTNKKYLEEAVIKLMQEGKLTKEKAEKILEYKKKRADELSKLTKEQIRALKRDNKKNSLLGDLIKDGIITEEEAQVIKAKLREMKDIRMNDGMQGLVDKGVLTAKDIENIRSYMLKVREERKAKLEKLKTMTAEERKQYFINAKKERKDILTRMVEDKVITKTQAEEIDKAIPELNRLRHRKF
ncbi:MAG TPA: hypothetical protein VEG39_17460 [Clostridia bacterium]|nr:hypothetical protein [Clostridia bacterium]